MLGRRASSVCPGINRDGLGVGVDGEVDRVLVVMHTSCSGAAWLSTKLAGQKPSAQSRYVLSHGVDSIL